MFNVQKILIFSLLIIASFQVFPAFGDDSECEVTARWTPPTTGTPVHHYLVDADINDLGFVRFSSSCQDTFFVFLQPDETTIRVRVAGVDASNRVGPFSETSLTKLIKCVRTSPPGKPDTPLRFP